MAHGSSGFMVRATVLDAKMAQPRSCPNTGPVTVGIQGYQT